jgi:hypothetical protein
MATHGHTPEGKSMSAIQLNKLVVPCGDIVDQTATNMVDAFGNIKGSPSFNYNYVIDTYGNKGKLPASGVWEIQKGAVEDVGTDQSHNTFNYVTAITGYAAEGVTGYVDGVISGTSTWTLQSSPQTIGGVSYPGFGLLVATANNSHSTTTMQAGTHLQLGLDLNATTGTIRDVTLATGAILDIYGANTTRFNKVHVVTNNAGGTVNWKGPNICGQGNLGNNGTYTNNGVTNVQDCTWSLGTGLAGSGVINIIDSGTFHNNGIQAIGSSNTFNINGCGRCNPAGVRQGALSINAVTTFAPKINVQSAACIKTHNNANVTFSGLLTGSAPLTVGNLGTPVNGVSAFTNTGNTYSGTMTVDGTTIGQSTGNSLQYAKIVLANGGRISSNNSTSQSIASLASNDSTTYWASGDFCNHYIKANGVTTYAGRLLWNGGSNTANFWLEGGSQNELTLTGKGNTGNIYVRNGARLVMNGATFTGTNGQVRVTPGGTVSTSFNWSNSCTYLLIDGTSKLEVRTNAAGSYGRINCAGGSGLDVRAGWKVDWPDVSAAGVFTILVANAKVGPLPTTGVNNTGRAITYSWSGNNLVATLV